MMLYFLVNKCSECFDLLNNYDTVGCNFTITSTFQPHYSGNFWWATSNYIKSLKKIPDGSERHLAEWWLLSNKSVKSYEIHNSRTNHYHSEYSLKLYKK